ncbi:hypothetical protein HMPREF9346_05187 [Escherichia coli MS 119-7]|nr:hypothetical protein HMPREF9346_05187 [Escherichia coli MS 119-7]
MYLSKMTREHISGGFTSMLKDFGKPSFISSIRPRLLRETRLFH